METLSEGDAVVKAGLYKYKGNLYLLIGLCREHDSDKEWVAYVPLRIEPEWTGPRIALREQQEFEERFHWVGERL